jgi:lipid-binding SYLF domain-containing protein
VACNLQNSNQVEDLHKMHKKLSVFFLIFTLGISVIGLSAPKQKSTNQMARADVPKEDQDYYERSQKAAEVLQALTSTPEKGIPRDLLEGAYGVAVFPHVVKAAFGVGGRWGKGILSTREKNGAWSTPIFVDIAGGSFGFQLGAQSTDLVLVFKNRRGVDSLLSSKLKLGADASVAAGPVGRSAEASTDVKLGAEIYAYSRSKGAFAGIALDGAVVTVNDSANEKVYGMGGRRALAQPRINSPVTMPFLAALRQYSPAATIK